MHSSHLMAGALLLVGGAAVAQSSSPRPAGRDQATPPPVQMQSLSGNVEHGRYIVEDIAHCAECHSPRDDRGNIIESQRFAGAPVPLRPPWPNDWAIFAPRNRGLPGYDDAMAMRLLTEGAIGRDGKPLRPPMPRFHLTRQDAADVIAYMRSLR